jgi:hypothetical protein
LEKSGGGGAAAGGCCARAVPASSRVVATTAIPVRSMKISQYFQFLQFLQFLRPFSDCLAPIGSVAPVAGRKGACLNAVQEPSGAAYKMP